MTKIQTNALRIVELLYSDIDINGIEKYKEFFSSYEGLMPIVYECNVDINYRIHIYEECVIFSTADGEMLLPKLKYDLESEFIESIQLACIKYLELKCQQLNIADNIE